MIQWQYHGHVKLYINLGREDKHILFFSLLIISFTHGTSVGYVKLQNQLIAFFCRLGSFQNFSSPFPAARLICYPYFSGENIHSDKIGKKMFLHFLFLSRDTLVILPSDLSYGIEKI